MTNCEYCGKSDKEISGVYTNGDGYGDAKYVGIDAGPHLFWCWDHAELAPSFSGRIDEEFKKRGWCGFLQAWSGRCRQPKPCHFHEREKCWKCGAPATTQCSVASSLVCGMPECKEHPHFHTHY